MSSEGPPTSRPARHALGSVLLLLVLSSWGCLTDAPAPAAHRAVQYENRGLGLRVRFDRGWQLVSHYGEAPPQLQSLFPPDKHPDESPLFIGHAPNRGLFVRMDVLKDAESARDHLLDILNERAAHDDRLEIYAASQAFDPEVARAIYRVRQGMVDYVVLDTLGRWDDGVVRLVFWLPSTSFSSSEGELLALANRLEVLEAGRWRRPWADLDARLTRTGMESIPLSDSPPPSPREGTACAEGQHALLWHVERPDLPGTASLFGSIHVGRSDLYPLAPEIERAFAEANHLVVEVDLASPASQRSYLEMAREAADSPSRSLRSELSPDVYRELEEALRGLGVDIATLDRMPAWMVSMQLMATQLQLLGFQAELGIDRHLLDRAADKAVHELESPESQIALMRDWDPDVVVRQTLASLGDGDIFRAEMEETIDYWRCGDEQGLASLLLERHRDEFEGADAFYDRLFEDRNLSMSDSIETLLGAPGRYFIVVGAGHLVGDAGIPTVLQGRGFEVRRD